MKGFFCINFRTMKETIKQEGVEIQVVPAWKWLLGI